MRAHRARRRRIPRWLKWAYTLFVAFLVPVYALEHGLANFLWFSNVAMLTMVLILWRESALLASTMGVLVLLPELGWNASYFGRLLLGTDAVGLTGYMFDPRHSLLVRGLSLYHVALPALLVWVLHRLRYDPRGFRTASGLAWVLLPITFRFASRERNINWTHGLYEEARVVLPAPLHVGALMIGFPLAVFWPTHRVLLRLFA